MSCGEPATTRARGPSRRASCRTSGRRFDHLVESARVDDAERFVVAAYGPIGCQFDVAPIYEWAPTARALDPAHVGPSTASVCAIAARGAIPRGDFEAPPPVAPPTASTPSRPAPTTTASSAPRDPPRAVGRRAGGERRVPRAQRRDRARSDDLHRQVWVLTYAGRAAEALDRAQRLGNRTLIALARSRDAVLAAERDDDDEARRAVLGGGAGLPQLPDAQPCRASSSARRTSAPARRSTACCCSGRPPATGSSAATPGCGRSCTRSRSASPPCGDFDGGRAPRGRDRRPSPPVREPRTTRRTRHPARWLASTPRLERRHEAAGARARRRHRGHRGARANRGSRCHRRRGSQALVDGRRRRPHGSPARGRRARRPRVHATSRSRSASGSAATPPRPTSGTSSSVSARPADGDRHVVREPAGRARTRYAA